jgi:hypothetical protein
MNNIQDLSWKERAMQRMEREERALVERYEHILGLLEREYSRAHSMHSVGDMEKFTQAIVDLKALVGNSLEDE